ncbi:MAG: succinylglutamate desuccinylase/aspartoacylase family protein [Dongiaceae bacterium]
MASETSRISADVDYERNGKQWGHLHVPNSTNESAFGTLMIPVCVIKNGTGPTLLLTGGVHGDEYEGPLAIMKLARRLHHDDVQGRLILIPGLNLPAFAAGQRLSPIDGKNLNRAFPGKREGTITEAIAHYVMHVLFPLADAVVDLHSGGSTLDYVPTAIIHITDNPQRDAASAALQRAFGAPIALANRELDDVGLLETTAEKIGKTVLAAELGGDGRVSKVALEVAETGVDNLLVHLGITKGRIVTPAERGRPATRFMDIPDLGCYVKAPANGIFEPFHELGAVVTSGSAIGQIHSPHHPDHPPVPVIASSAGEVICIRPIGKSEIGDCLFVLAREIAQ